jgi:uncharacterized membrane protein
MTLRPPRERLIQTLAYEAGGLLVATPLFSLAFGTGGGTSAALLAALSAAVLFWTPIHNVLWDRAEWGLYRRIASDRPQSLRVLHALSLELSSVIATLPILIFAGGLTLTEAIFADIGLTLVYTAYGYVFHLVFDRLRPVSTEGGRK